jgi:hypothetical protein
MKYLQQHIKLYLVLIVLFVLPILVNAQPVFDDDVNDVPIDGGLSLLVAAGVGYGAKKIQQSKLGKKK